MYAPHHARIATPVGTVTVSGDAQTLHRISIGADEAASGESVASPALREAAAQIAAWFDGRLTVFDLPLAPAATPRGEALRAAIVGVGYGETLSYGALSRSIESSARAIGQACARNPLPLIVPCHRITNTDGSLGAYSAGTGPATKAWLLDFEQRGRHDRLF